MFGFKHGEIALLQSKLPDVLICHPGYQPLDHALHGFFERADPSINLLLNIVRQRKLFGLFHIFCCEVAFPDLADPGKVAFAVKCFVNVRGRDLSAEPCREDVTDLDDFLFGINGGARHVILLCLPVAGVTWVRSGNRKTNYQTFSFVVEKL
ncbi:hypothetical protein [Parasedimentitalea denitrificans]|uniref:hypothetical protein n=1 Tax=Parasedimentitalea denitrificans TaxID=2211118 RepID=UPI00142FB995|nr:hypothetical protein [Sedimentitalea sp. CY04]